MNFAPRDVVPRVLALAGLVLCGSLLKADVIFSNFGADFAYYPGSGVVVTNGTSDFSVGIELPTMTSNYDLTSIEFVATAENPDPSNSVTLSVYADDGGVPGGAPIESLTSYGQLWDFDGSLAPVLSVDSILNPELLAGNNYWIVMDGPISEGLVWDLNSTRTFGYVETDGTPGNWIDGEADGTNGVLEVDGVIAPSLPEPGTWFLMLGGLAFVVFGRKNYTGRQHCR